MMPLIIAMWLTYGTVAERYGSCGSDWHPTIWGDLFPIASFVAAFIAFAWAGRAMELVATQAGGIRTFRLVLPVLVTALILSFAAAILHETVILRANQIWHHRVGNAGEAIDFGREAFWYHNGRVITNITKADAATRTLHGVEIFERNSAGEIARVVRADRVRIGADGRWHIEAAEIWSFDPADVNAPPDFESGGRMVLDLDSLRGSALLGAEPTLLPLASLARYLKAQPADSSRSYRRLANLYHERLSQPWLVLLFAFMALPFGLRVDATGRIIPPAVAAACVVGLFFFLRSAGVALSQQEILPVGLSQWYSIGVFAVLAAIALRRTAT